MTKRLILIGLACLAISSLPAWSETPSARLIASPESGWPQFRGPRRDGVSDETGLLTQWAEGGPRRMWVIDKLGQGFSSPVFSGDRMVLTGDFADRLMIMAFDSSGKMLWQTANGAAWKGPYPGSRASATWYGGRVYHQNAHGRVTCLDGKSGRELWAVEVLLKFGGLNPTWGLSECLLVDQSAVYVTAGGPQGLVVALNRLDGKLLWKSAPLYETDGERIPEGAGYASPILVRFDGRRLLIGASAHRLYCLDASDGVIQWTQPMPTTYSVLAMTPILVGDAVFMTAPHGNGGLLYRLKPGRKIGMEKVWQTELDTCQSGAVFIAGKLLGAFYQPRQGWAAVDAATGKVSCRATDLVKGIPLYADGRLYALTEDGWMLLLEPRADRFVRHGRFKFAQASPHDAWAYPVILDGRLYLRYHDTLACFNIRR